MTKDLITAYFPGEGRHAMTECIDRSMDWCADNAISSLVIFSGTGEGPYYAARQSLSVQRYQALQIVAVTPPFGRPYRQVPGDDNSPLVRSGVNPAMRAELRALGVEIASAHLPFKEMYTGRERSSEWSRVAEAYGVLGGGFALCIQAVLVACDAGLVNHGEEVVALSADTSLVATASRTESFLSPSEGLLVRHIICRPIHYNISKRIHETVQTQESTSSGVPPVLGPGGDPRQLEAAAKKMKASRARKRKPAR